MKLTIELPEGKNRTTIAGRVAAEYVAHSIGMLNAESNLLMWKDGEISGFVVAGFVGVVKWTLTADEV